MARYKHKVKESRYFDIFNRPKRKTRDIVVFDEESRLDFVRGFRNRKQERRRRALEQQKAKQRLARQIARKEKREQLQKALEALRTQASDDGEGIYCPPAGTPFEQETEENPHHNTHNNDIDNDNDESVIFSNETQTYETPTLRITTTITNTNEQNSKLCNSNNNDNYNNDSIDSLSPHDHFPSRLQHFPSDFHDLYQPSRKQQKLQRKLKQSFVQRSNSFLKTVSIRHKKKRLFSEKPPLIKTLRVINNKSRKKMNSHQKDSNNHS